MYYFERAFPYKTVYIKDRKKTKWTTRGIKVSSQKMRLLNNVKKYEKLPNAVLNYINRYQKMYKNVIKEAKRKL
jgi:Mg-chelatase subunit ChlI